MWKVSFNELILLTTHPVSFIASVTFPIASSIMSTMPAWVRLALLLIPRYFCSYFRSTLNGPCTLWNGRYKNKGLDALCDRITLLACCSIEKETQVINWFGNVLLTWFSLIFWSWQDGFVKLLLSVSWVNKLLSSFYVKYFCHRDSSPSIFWSPKLAQKERTSLSRFFFIYSYFEKLLSEKMCSRQSRKVIWDMFNTLFLTLWLSNLLLLLSFSTRRHTSMASSAILSNFFEKQCTHSHPQYLSVLSRALYPTTFLETAVYISREL